MLKLSPIKRISWMVNGYEFFIEDIKEVFSDELVKGSLKIKHVNWTKNQDCNSVILESSYQYLNFHIDTAYLIVYIIDKISHEFINIDELIVFLNSEVDLKQEKRNLFYDPYFEEAKMKGMTTEEQIIVSNKHWSIGELNAYKKILDKYLSEIIYLNKFSWTDKIKKSGSFLYTTKMSGIDKL